MAKVLLHKNLGLHLNENVCAAKRRQMRCTTLQHLALKRQVKWALGVAHSLKALQALTAQWVRLKRIALAQ
jgi:hypothetical protein